MKRSATLLLLLAAGAFTACDGARRVPAPSAGITLGEKTGWFAGLRYRYFGPRPLTEDGAFVSPATGLLNGRLGYRFDNGWRVQLDGFNECAVRFQVNDRHSRFPGLVLQSL